jgi:hypothetical protein
VRFHDAKSATAAMLPAFLKELKEQEYQEVPATALTARCTTGRRR